MRKSILVAGATGNLGERIVWALVERGAEVRAVVRAGSDKEKIRKFERWGVKIYTLHHWNLEELANACVGVSCVVSALAGLREVIIDAQKVLLDAAIKAGVPRFIPSDYSLDFTKFSHGENRNLDWRREFHTHLDRASILSTSIFNGAFTDMLTGQMPVILFKQKMVLYWGSADATWNFTTMDDTAAFTANAALDLSTPRYLRIAGDQITPGAIREVVNKVAHVKFRLFRPGGQKLLGVIIKIARIIAPGKNELYPAWQGMQYMHNMIDRRSKIVKLDNNRYPEIHWTSVEELLTEHYESNASEGIRILV